MGNVEFSNGLLARVRSSAIKYARTVSDYKHCSMKTVNRIEILTNYSCSGKEIIKHNQLDSVILLLNSYIMSEQKKSRGNLPGYDYNRHLELHKLQCELKEKRSKL